MEFHQEALGGESFLCLRHLAMGDWLNLERRLEAVQLGLQLLALLSQRLALGLREGNRREQAVDAGHLFRQLAGFGAAALELGLEPLDFRQQALAAQAGFEGEGGS